MRARVTTAARWVGVSSLKGITAPTVLFALRWVGQATPRQNGASPTGGDHHMDVERLTSLFGLEGRRAVVTGGSRGIGRMIAEGLLDAGCEVIIIARKVEQVTAATDEMSAKGTVIAVPSDVSTDEGIAHLARAVGEQWDSLDILVNNAGATWGEPIDEFSAQGMGQGDERRRQCRVLPHPEAVAASTSRGDTGTPGPRDQHRVGQRAYAAGDGDVLLLVVEGGGPHAHAPSREASCVGPHHGQRKSLRVRSSPR
jgi:hypothetical protein